MWPALFAALAAVPKALDLMEKLAIWLIQQVALYRENEAKAEMAKAIVEAKQKKDTSQLDKLFDPDKR